MLLSFSDKRPKRFKKKKRAKLSSYMLAAAVRDADAQDRAPGPSIAFFIIGASPPEPRCELAASLCHNIMSHNKLVYYMYRARACPKACRSLYSRVLSSAHGQQTTNEPPALRALWSYTVHPIERTERILVR